MTLTLMLVEELGVWKSHEATSAMIPKIITAIDMNVMYQQEILKSIERGGEKAIKICYQKRILDYETLSELEDIDDDIKSQILA